MSQATPVRGLLLDAGGVLYGPIDGRWNPRLVEAAVALGYQGVALGRKRPHAPANVPWIDSLEGVLDYLRG